MVSNERSNGLKYLTNFEKSEFDCMYFILKHGFENKIRLFPMDLRNKLMIALLLIRYNPELKIFSTVLNILLSSIMKIDNHTKYVLIE